MYKINLKDVTSESVAGVIILLVALANAVLQIFGINALPIEDDKVTNIVSTIFLIITALWNTWKNRNITSASQTAQNITNAIKNGEILEDDIKAMLNQLKR